MLERRTQDERRGQTRRALVSTARQLFAEQGYAATATPDIVAGAGVTRGALYHHFADKKALFRAVVEEESLLLAMTINAGSAADETPGPVRALIGGSEAFIAAMADPGRRQIMLVDAPAVLGRDVVDAINRQQGLQTLIARLRGAMEAGAVRKLPVEPLAHLFGAMFERAALSPPEQASDYGKAIKALIRGLKI